MFTCPPPLRVSFQIASSRPSGATDSEPNHCQALAPSTQQSCHLVVLSGREALIVLQIDSPLPMRYSVMLGAKFPFEETSSGGVRHRFRATWKAARTLGT